MMKHRRLPIAFLLVALAILTMLALSACSLTKVSELSSVSFCVEGEEYAALHTDGNEALRFPRDPARAGYRFLGWYTDEGVWEKPFTETSLAATALSADMKVYARWEAIVYTATLLVGDETLTTLSYTVEDSALALPAVPERAGYTGAWESYTLGSSDTVIRAIYTPITYEITYEDPMNGTNRNQKSYTVESATLTLVPPTGVPGYRFDGWFNGDTQVTEIKTGSSGALHLTARWSVRDYTITYANTDGATHENPLTYQIFDAPLSLSGASRAGYHFGGWYIDEALTRSIGTLTGYGDRTLYAKWTPITYTVTFRANGKTVGTASYTVENTAVSYPAIPRRNGYTAAWEKKALTMGDVTLNAVYTLIDYTVTFLADGKVVGSDTYNVENTSLRHPVIPEKAGYTAAWERKALTYGDVTLNAVYTPIRYTVTYLANGSKVGTSSYTVEDRSPIAPAVPERRGYSGAWETPTLTMGDVTVNAVYTIINYKVTFTANGKTVGEDTYTVEDRDVAIPDVPERTGYTGAWEALILSVGDVTVNALYTPINYTVTFVADGVTVGETTYNIENTDVKKPTVPSKLGYAAAWEEKTLSTGDVTLNAVYTIIYYKVTFMANGVAVGEDTYTVLDREITRPAIPDRGGYSSVWEEKELTVGDVTLSALYTPIDYTVTFLVAGEKIGEATYNIENTDVAMPAIPGREGYSSAWEKKALTYGDVSLSAVYTPIDYIITFVAGGVTVGQTTYNVENRDYVNPAVPSRLGYSGAWQTPTLSTGDVTVNAVYTLIHYTVTFTADGRVVGSDTYTVEDKEITRPEIPGKTGYSSAWQDITLSVGDVTVPAVYTAIVYKVTFVAGGVTVGEGSYTVEDSALATPAVPDRIGYTGAWEEKTLSTGDITVNAVYTLINYKVTFVAGGATVGELTYTVEDREISAPAVPLLQCMLGAWESYTLTYGDLTVHAVYTEHHSYDVTLTPASCLTAGLEVSHCPDCGKHVELTLPALGHNPIETLHEKASCLTDGLRVTVCDRCGDRQEEVLSALGHAWSLTESFAASCESEGHTLSTCSRCAETKTDILAALGHIWHETASTVSSCMQSGVTDYLCSRCSGSKQEAVIASGHSFLGGICADCGQAEFTPATDLSYTVKDGAVTILGIRKAATEIRIPAEIDGYPVTAIDKTAFKSCSAKIIVIPQSVLSIGEGAFSACARLEVLEIPFIGIASHAANEANRYPLGVLFGTASYTGGTRTTQRYYYGTGSYQYQDPTYYIPATLTRVIVTGGYINSYAFQNVSSVKEVVFGADVIFQKSQTPFIGASSIERVVLPEGMTAYPDSLLAQIATTSFTVPEGITELGRSLFASASKLTQISLPSTLTVIGENVFYNCSSLAQISLPMGVTVIPKSAFQGCSSLTALPLTHHIREIGESAFSSCSSVTEITVPSTVVSIGKAAFAGIPNLTKITLPFVGASAAPAEGEPLYPLGYVFGSSSGSAYYGVSQAYRGAGGSKGNYSVYFPRTLTTVVITGGTHLYGAFSGMHLLTGVTLPSTIECSDYAFYNCTALTELSLGESVSRIGSYAFYNCSKLRISGLDGAGIREIGSYAFYNCDALTGAITLPASLESIGSYAFQNCSGVTSLSLPTGLLSIGSYAFDSCTALGEISLGESLTSLGENAFRGTAVTSLSVPTSLKELPQYFASGLTSLSSVTLHAGIERIGSYAFEGCTGITAIDLGDALTELGVSVFKGCSALGAIEIPSGVTALRANLFDGCTSLTSVALHAAIELVEPTTFKGCTALPGTATHLGGVYLGVESKPYMVLLRADSNATEFHLLPGTLSHTMGGFMDATVTRVVIEEGVTTLPSYIFEGARRIASVSFPSTLTYLGSYAFRLNEDITELVIPDTVLTIEGGALGGMSGLRRLTIPFIGQTRKSFTDSYLHPFGHIFGDGYGIEGMTRISQKYIYSGNSTTSASYYLPLSLTEVTVTGGEILPYAFYGCTMLERIHIPAVSQIGKYAFSDCTGMTSFTLPQTVGTIGESAFSGCSALSSVHLPGLSHLLSLTLGAGNKPLLAAKTVTTADGSRLDVVTIPEGATAIPSILAGFTTLTEIILPDSITVIPDGAFKDCTGLSSVTLGKYVESIGASAFYGCSALTEIRLPATLKTVGASAFANTGLCSIDLSTVTSIGASALQGCHSLTEVRLGLGITAIPDALLQNCTALRELTLPGTVVSIGSSALRGCTSLTAISLPDSVKSLGGYVFYGCEGLSSVSLGKVETIGSQTFGSCPALRELVVPTTVTSVGSYIFGSYSALEKLTMPFVGTSASSTSAFLTHFGQYADYAPANLKTVIIRPAAGATLKIGSNVFQSFPSIEELYLDLGSATATFGSGVGITTGKTYVNVASLADWLALSFSSYIYSPLSSGGILTVGGEPLTGTVTVPAGVTLGKYAFYGVEGIDRLILPEDITVIPSYAFAGAMIGEVVLPDTLLTVEQYAFEGAGIRRITVPDSVTTIGTAAFYNCASLEYVYLGDGLTSVGQRILGGCTSLVEMDLPFAGIPSDNPTRLTGSYFIAFFEAQSRANGSLSGTVCQDTYTYSRYTYYYYAALPETLARVTVRGGTIADARTLSGLSLDLLVLGKDVTVDPTALQKVGAIRHATVPMSAFPQYSTAGREALESLTFTSYDATVALSFTSCSSLARLILPSGITELSPLQFAGTPYFLTVELGENERYVFDGGCIIERETGTVIVGFDATAIPSYVKAIGESAFYYRTGFSTLTLTSALTEIGEGAFEGCVITHLTAPADMLSLVDPAYIEVLYITEGDTLPVMRDVYVSLRELYLCDGITTIPDHAFHSLTELRTVVLGNAVESIGAGAFWGTALTSFTVPSTVTVIGQEAFACCSALESLVLSEALTSLPYRMIYYSYALTELIIPDSVTELVPGALDGCSLQTLSIGRGFPTVTGDFALSSLKTLILREGVTEIADEAFAYLRGLESVSFPSTLRSIGASAFRTTGITEAILPKGLQAIGESAFEGCAALTSLSLGESLTAIPARAFLGCSSLMAVALPATTLTVGVSAFESCSALTELSLGESLTEIAEYAFRETVALRSVTVPASLRTVGTHAFYCQSGSVLGTVTAESLAAWLGISFADLTANPLYYARILSFRDGSRLEGDVTVPDGVTEIGSYALTNLYGVSSINLGGVVKLGKGAFYLADVTSFALGALTEIGQEAFAGSSVRSVRLPDTLVSLGYDAFKLCHLDSFDTGDGLRTLPSSLFLGGDIGELRIGRSIVSIGTSCFRSVDIDTLYLDSSVLSEDSIFETSELFKGAGGSDGMSIVICESVTRIPSYLFYVSSSTYAPTVPSLIFLGSPERIGARAFSNLKIGHLEANTLNAATSSFLGAQVTSLTVRAETLTVGFGSPALTTVVLDGVRRIPSGAFSLSTALTSVTLIGTEEIGEQAFYGCSQLQSITLPSSVRVIDRMAFYNCSALTELVIPSGVTVLSDAVLAGCEALTRLTLPIWLSEIGARALADCASLTELALPAGVKRIGSQAFSGTGILSLALPSALRYASPDSFEGVSVQTTEADGAIYYGNAENPYLILVMISDSSLTHFTVRDETRIVYSLGSVPSLTLGSGLTMICSGAIDAKLVSSVTMPKASEHYAILDGILYAMLDEQYMSSSLGTALPYHILFAPKGGLTGDIKVYADPNLWLQNQPGLTGVTFVGDCIAFTGRSSTFIGSPNIVRLVIPSNAGGSSSSSVFDLATIFAPLKKLEYLEFPMYAELGRYFTETAFEGGVAVSQCSGLTSSYGNLQQHYTTYYIPATLRSVTVNGGYIGGGYYKYDPWGPSYDWSWGYFENCTMLETVTLRGMTEVAEYAFKSCSNLRTVTLAPEVTKICEGAFYRCSAITAVYLEGGSEHYAAIQAQSEASGNSSYISGKFVLLGQ